MPLPWGAVTYAGARGARSALQSFPGGMHESLCTDVLDRAGKCRADPRRTLPERHPSAAVWVNQRKKDQISGKILAKNTGIDAKVIAKMTRTTFATRLRVSLAQPWLDVFAEYGVIPGSFEPIDLVK